MTPSRIFISAVVAVTPSRIFNSEAVDVKIVDNNDSDALLGHIIKNAPIPVGSSLELIDGGSKVVVQQHDEIQAKSSINNSLDVIVSAVDAIST